MYKNIQQLREKQSIITANVPHTVQIVKKNYWKNKHKNFKNFEVILIRNFKIFIILKIKSLQLYYYNYLS